MNSVNNKANSKYLQAKTRLHKSEPIVRVFVEDMVDVPFWKLFFDNQNVKTKIQPATGDGYSNGIKEVLKLKDNVGKYFLLCVDSDYNYLLQSSTIDSELINTNKYIFQTYTYSIENYKCFADSLSTLMLNATKQDKAELFDYEHFLSEYSKIIYKLFVYSVYFKINNEADFSISILNKIIGFNKNIDISNNGENSLIELKNSVDKKLLEFDFVNEDEIQKLESKLNALGVTSENTYLFISGHTLFNNVVLKSLKLVEKLIVETQKKNIENISKTDKIRKEKLKHFNKERTDVKILLQQNTNFANCFLVEKINSDIEKYKTINE